jgi:hypothetical protein
MPMILFGQNANFSVYYESALPGQGVNINALAQSVLDYCEYDRQCDWTSLFPGNATTDWQNFRLTPGPNLKSAIVKAVCE